MGVGIKSCRNKFSIALPSPDKNGSDSSCKNKVIHQMHLESYGVTGCLLFTQITREEILHKHKTITFDGWVVGLLLVTPLMLTVRWSIGVSTHLTLMIPLIFPIQSTVLNNVHLCSQPSWCTEIKCMVSRQEVSRVLLFCANRQNVSGISDSLTSACVVTY